MRRETWPTASLSINQPADCSPLEKMAQDSVAFLIFAGHHESSEFGAQD
jgi:hypothetical protein